LAVIVLVARLGEHREILKDEAIQLTAVSLVFIMHHGLNPSTDTLAFSVLVSYHILLQLKKPTLFFEGFLQIPTCNPNSN
jgi:hypothetical protein